MNPMRRRDLLSLFPALALAQRPGGGPLKITGIDGIVIRTPNDNAAPESLIEMPPGATTGGVGLGTASTTLRRRARPDAGCPRQGTTRRGSPVGDATRLHTASTSE
jgi:hypothetical protein